MTNLCIFGKSSFTKCTKELYLLNRFCKSVIFWHAPCHGLRWSPHWTFVGKPFPTQNMSSRRAHTGQSEIQCCEYSIKLHYPGCFDFKILFSIFLIPDFSPLVLLLFFCLLVHGLPRFKKKRLDLNCWDFIFLLFFLIKATRVNVIDVDVQ